MKAKLLKKVRQEAEFCAHINSITITSSLFGEFVSGVSIGYGISNNSAYKGVWSYGMSEAEYNRRIRQIYWGLNKDKYYSKYRKNIS